VNLESRPLGAREPVRRGVHRFKVRPKEILTLRFAF
jgi:hypothetical protein